MKKVVDFYRTQIELMWRWRAGRVALLKRAIVALIAGVIAFNITAWLFPGLLRIDELGGGLIAVRLHRRAQPARPAGRSSASSRAARSSRWSS